MIEFYCAIKKTSIKKIARKKGEICKKKMYGTQKYFKQSQKHTTMYRSDLGL